MASNFTITSTFKLRSGNEMPIFGLGVAATSDCYEACKVALQHGYRLIDTAQYYFNEEQVGKAVRDSGLPREEVFVTTKIFSSDHGYENTKAAIDKSLSKLNIGYINLFLIHDPKSGKQKRLETYKALLEAKQAGKVRAVGVSNYSGRHMDEIKEAGYEMPSVNQIELHPFCQQKEITAYDNAHGVVTQAFCPLARARFDNPVIQEIAQKYHKESAQILLRWSIQRGFAPIPKSSQPARIKSNADIYDFVISQEDMAKINALDKGKAGSISWNPVDAA
ncbi:Aldo/keto reductase [Agrocybe pediades]|nr:Aldo/keto reductase [Agrocybe pediades]